MECPKKRAGRFNGLGKVHPARVIMQIVNPLHERSFSMRTFISTLCAAALIAPAMIVTAPAAEARSKYREWRGEDGRTYCRKSNGTVGLVVGGASGALLGRAVDGGRSRATGTIVGAAAGALLGRELDRKRRCR
jgi:Glycine zipper 2TM domain